ncbi:MAG: hypothetical protein VXZ16_00210 [Bacteroidota bacterium]|nr:hypothetical protein [Bacteroidota bacterium]
MGAIQGWGQSGSLEDEAEEYWRRALESERQAQALELQELKDEVARQKMQWRAEASDWSERFSRDVAALARNSEDLNEQKKLLHEAIRDEIEALKRSQDVLKATTADYMRRMSEEADQELKKLEKSSKEREFSVYLSPGDRDIPQGVQETSEPLQNGVVIMRTVREGDVVKRYRKVVMKTRTYYFCGDQSITKTRWDLETNLSND